jgi:AsmA-like C-terminal region
VGISVPGNQTIPAKRRRADLSVFGGIAGTLSSDDRFDGVLRHIDLQGTTDTPDFEVRRSNHTVHLTTRFHAIVNGTNGDVLLQRVDASYLKTTVVTVGSIAGRPGEKGKTASLNMTVRNGWIQDVLRLFVKDARPPMSGVTSFSAHVTIPPQKRPFLEKVELRADFGIGDGEFKPGTQDSVNKLSARARGEKNVTADDVISNLKGHVVLRHRVATFSNIAFNIPGALGQMHGTYNLLNERVDFHGTLKTDAKLSETTSGLKSVLLRPFDSFFKRKPKGAVIPVEITGTYHDAHFGIELPPNKEQERQQPAAR